MQLQVAESEVCQVTEEVWNSVLGLGVRREDGGAAAAGQQVTGRIWISGAWEGAVVVCSSAYLARRATAILLQVEPDAATADDIRDAFGELTNIIGGNIKSLLPGPSQLSLPDVCEDPSAQAAPVPAAGIEVVFDCEGQPLRVMVLAEPRRQVT